jgi:all-trans-8'-apo-beta-carotenal 15,15'-oxygenase
MQTVMDSSIAFSREDWQRGYASLKQEFDYWIDAVEGIIPSDLHGTLFRNGPGLLDVNGERLHHPFDGDGMICAISFKQGRAHFRNRFVRTEGYLREQSAGRILYRGVFGTQKPGGWLANAFDFRLKNIANTHVIYWVGKLLALWEAAEPHRLDPSTLETLGLDDLDGVLQPGEAFAAHPRIDPACDRTNGEPCLVNFSIKPGLSSTFKIYEFNPLGQLVSTYDRVVPGFAFVHDFVITPDYCIFFRNPVRFNPLPYAIGLQSAGQCITFHPEQPTRIVLIPRSPGNQDQTMDEQPAPQTRPAGKPGAAIFEVLSGFVFHHVNAFEQGNQLVIDSICYASLPAVEPDADYRETDFDALAPGQLWRFRLDLDTGAVQRQCLESRCCEFPAVHPNHVGRPYRYTYLAAAHAPSGNAPHQAILKVDMESNQRQIWSAAPRGFVGEPVFVPRSGPAEDDGWLLALVFDAACDRSSVVILDARDLNRGPVARLHLKHHVPYGLHGSFTPQWFMD